MNETLGQSSPEGPRSATQVLLLTALILVVSFGLIGTVGYIVFAKTDDVLLALMSAVVFGFATAGILLLIGFATVGFRKFVEVMSVSPDWHTPKGLAIAVALMLFPLVVLAAIVVAAGPFTASP